LETKYRISQEAKGRFLAGSSMGALISAYIGTRYPETFSSLGIFSIASWVSEKPFLDYLKDEGSYRKTRFFIQVGTEEVRNEDSRVDYAGSQKYISNSLNFLEGILLQGAKIENIRLYIGAGKTHNEEAWAGYMPEFLLWLNERL
ncbi:MAG TPA: alpha/beta hydrolase-fold protein, partial [Bacteroidales bacterium]|nr:alpha/beta hydrolase-fold protein [Bacteroidales bacterium]